MAPPLDPLSRVLPPLRPGTERPRPGAYNHKKPAGEDSKTDSDGDTGAAAEDGDRGDDRAYDRAQKAEDGSDDDGHLFDDYA